MKKSEQVHVILADGRSAWIEEGEEGLATASPRDGEVTVLTTDGERFRVPASALLARPAGGYFLDRRKVPPAGRRRDIEAVGAPSADPPSAEGTVLPVIEEQLHVGKREVVTGTIRVHKEVREEQVTVDEPLMVERIEVERVPINRVVSAAPAPRQEGDVLVVPVVEEEIVISKQLVLKEEVHLRRVREERHAPQQVNLRREDVKVERVRKKPSR